MSHNQKVNKWNLHNMNTIDDLVEYVKSNTQCKYGKINPYYYIVVFYRSRLQHITMTHHKPSIHDLSIVSEIHKYLREDIKESAKENVLSILKTFQERRV